MALTTITGNIVSVNAIQGTLIADNAITAVHIATNAVSGTLIADNAVTAVHIAQNSITVTQLADDCVESDKIADGVITTNHLNKAMISSQTEVSAATGDFVLLGDTSDSNNLKKTPLSSIAALSAVGTGDITTAKIADDAVTGAKIENAVTIATSVTSPLVDGQNFKVNGGQGSDGQVLTSTGSGVAWEDAAGGVDGVVSSADATAITINSSENVGIGTGSPSTRTHIYSSASSSPLLVESTANTYVGIKNTTQTAYIGAVTSNMTFENNGSERLRINSSGHTLPGANNTYDLGATATRWRNIYTNDLQLSNEGGDSNEVDGTTGSWTIQEGSDNLFIINRNTGKKYKFLLEEV